MGNTSHRDADARRWRVRIQRHYQIARAQSLELVHEAVDTRATRQNAHATEHAIERGFTSLAVSGPYVRKLVHMWHGPFRVAGLVSAYAVRLETHGTPYQLFPIVHVSKLKLVREFLSRPELRLTVHADERFDFDEEHLPEDSWEARDADEGVYEVEEVEQILDVREGRKTRYGRTRREFHVKWLGYDETSWVDEVDLNCGGLVYDFLRQRTGRSRFGVMQSQEDAPAEE
ncbi:hypothetical protein PHMEG_00039046 [Phytophthora megakarya]|uniref:Chromo domain-containing protein n=1 Tax=Phytophthora megakarya TaxID=4795 RepID=A0A225UGI5_9STRA|nr:hypothetical protein PHMEG_00039046 [Phytophthora megakarya]